MCKSSSLPLDENFLSNNFEEPTTSTKNNKDCLKCDLRSSYCKRWTNGQITCECRQGFQRSSKTSDRCVQSHLPASHHQSSRYGGFAKRVEPSHAEESSSLSTDVGGLMLNYVENENDQQCVLGQAEKHATRELINEGPVNVQLAVYMSAKRICSFLSFSCIFCVGRSAPLIFPFLSFFLLNTICSPVHTCKIKIPLIRKKLFNK
uniref:Uncharacterized protein n=1 Tax=Meloidogyne incognita TaxID=6306 RepID=A0A914M401_MELIC